jgi:hypothetical protein
VGRGILEASLKTLSDSQGSHPQRIDRDSKTLGQFLPAINFLSFLTVVVLENQFAVVRGKLLQALPQTIDTRFGLIILFRSDC